MFHIRDQGERFRDRRDAGLLLAKKLAAYANDSNVVVLGLPRGGVPVAWEIARTLGAPLDTFEVRKLGVPGHEELAMGAIGSGGAIYLNTEAIRALRITPEQIDAVVARERRELERREKLYRDNRPRPNLAGTTAILVDDGIATGSTMQAAIASLRRHRPARIVVAIPVAPPESLDELRAQVDEVVCWTTPDPFYAVGAAYDDFAQVSDDEVRALLELAFQRPKPDSPRRDPADSALGATELVR
jgi:putative phosphoribosyl transferase